MAPVGEIFSASIQTLGFSRSAFWDYLQGIQGFFKICANHAKNTYVNSCIVDLQMTYLSEHTPDRSAPMRTPP